MNDDQINNFLTLQNDMFPSEQIPAIREQLRKLSPDLVAGISFKQPLVVFLFAFFLGIWGIDRFILGQVGLGILKLVTLGGFGFWALVDWFTAHSRARRYNARKLLAIA